MKTEADIWYEEQEDYILSRDAQYRKYDEIVRAEHDELKVKGLLRSFGIESGLTCFAKACLLLVPIFGIMLQQKGIDSSFANSGGLLVIISAFVSIHSTRQKATINTLMSIELERNLRYAMYLEFRNRMPFQRIGTYPIEQELSPLKDIYSGKQTEIRKRVAVASSGIRYLELTLLFLGTAIWAFGGYIYKLVV